MSDAIFVAAKASGRPTIGDKKEIESGRDVHHSELSSPGLNLRNGYVAITSRAGEARS